MAATLTNRTSHDQPEKKTHQMDSKKSVAGQTKRNDILKCVGSSHHLAHNRPWAMNATNSMAAAHFQRPRNALVGEVGVGGGFVVVLLFPGFTQP